MQETLKELKVICLAKLSDAKANNDAKKIEIYSIINDVLNAENAFDKIDMEIAINMINDLVDDMEKAKKLYIELLK